MYTGRSAKPFFAGNFIAGIAASLLLSTASFSAQAESTIMLQLGQHASAPEAQAEWAKLQTAHPAELGRLTASIAPVVTPEGTSVYRTLAGALSSRGAAQDICANLSKSQTPCLVVETSMQSAPVANFAAPQAPLEPIARFVPPVVPSNAPLAAEDSLPPLAAESAPTSTDATPVAEKKSFTSRMGSWFGLGKEEQPAPAPQAAPIAVSAAPAPVAAPVEAVSETTMQPLPSAPMAAPSYSTPAYNAAAAPSALANRAPKNLAEEAGVATTRVQLPPQGTAMTSGQYDVQVAEAIRVPLSSPLARGISNNVPNRPVGYGGFPSQNLPENTFWAQINSFASKDDALGYLNLLRYEHPLMMQNLRARVVSPMQAHGQPRQSSVKLRVGPFTSQTAMGQLCNVAAQQQLKCTIVKDAGRSYTSRRPAKQGGVYAGSTSGFRHQRQTIDSQQRPAYGAFWVQLGAFDSVAQAERRWSDLMAVYPSLLNRQSPQISYPPLSQAVKTSYNLRVGPFSNVASAGGLCRSLQANNIMCTVMRAR